MWTWQGGGGVCQMSILLHKPYLVKLSTKGGGGVKNAQNSVHMVYGRPLLKKNPEFRKRRQNKKYWFVHSADHAQPLIVCDQLLEQKFLSINIACPKFIRRAHLMLYV